MEGASFQGSHELLGSFFSSFFFFFGSLHRRSPVLNDVFLLLSGLTKRASSKAARSLTVSVQMFGGLGLARHPAASIWP